jgi:hypothetical protein
VTKPSQLPPPFEVSADLVRDLKALIADLTNRSRSSAVTVPAVDFPAWLVALGKEHFYAQTMRSGQTFIRSGYAWVGDPVDGPMLSVTCDTPPAPWVSFPETEGDRRYVFRYTTNPLAHNETESNQ